MAAPIPNSRCFRRLELEVIDSTSLHARRLVEAGEPETEAMVIVARTQTGGVGRMGRPWTSPPGGLWFTMIWQPSRRLPALTEGLGLRIGVAVTQGLRTVAEQSGGDPARLLLKWPNDVLVDGRKVCGVLTEVAGRGEGLRALVGVGVNLDIEAASMPEGLRPRTASLHTLTGRAPEPESVLTSLIGRVAAAIDGPWPDPALIGHANAMLWGIGTEQVGVLEDGTADFGTYEGLDGLGVPVVRTSRGMGRLPTTAI